MPAHRSDRRPTDPRRDDEPSRPSAAMIAGQRATALVLLAAIATSLPHPWSLLGLPVALLALVLALRAVAGHVSGGLWGWAAWHLIAVGFAGYLVLLGALQAAFPSQLQAWTRCSRGALTRQAQGVCDARLDESTPGWLSRVIGSADQ